jgi:hypothetical protein
MEFTGRIIYVEFAERKTHLRPSRRPLEPLEVITTDGTSLYHYYLTQSTREGATYCDSDDLEIEPASTPIRCSGLYHMAYWVASEYASLVDIEATYTSNLPPEHPLSDTYTRRRMRRVPPSYLRRYPASGRVRRSGGQGPWNILDEACEGRTVYCSVCRDSFDESENWPCSHVCWCDECSGFSTPDERCRHIRGPNRLPDPIWQFCQRCGHKQVVVGPASLFRTKAYGPYRGKCMYCHARVADWAFLADFRRLHPDILLHLSCPWTHRMYEEEQTTHRKEHGSQPDFTFRVADLGVSVGTAGNGPFCYSLASRFRLQGRCPVCGNFAGDYEFFNETNRQALLSVLTTSRGEGDVAARKEHVC